MDEVLSTLAQVAFWVGGAWWCYVSRVKKIDERRTASWTAWLRRPLREPPPRTDWDAFERRVARELAADAEAAEEQETEALLARGRSTTGTRARHHVPPAR